MEKQITMSEECKRVLDTIKQELNFYDVEQPYPLYVPAVCIFDTMNAYNYELYDMGFFALEQYYSHPGDYMSDSTKEKKYYKEKNDYGFDLFQILFTHKQQDEDFAILFIGEESSGDNVDWEIYKIIFIEKERDTVIFDKQVGFITEEQLATPMEESENNNTNDLENRVNTLEDKLDTIIKMLANK